jgi:hypothetical protein
MLKDELQVVKEKTFAKNINCALSFEKQLGLGHNDH